MKILYVTTVSGTVNAFLIPHIKMLVEQGHQVDVAFNIKTQVKQEIISMGCKIHSLEFERSPLNKGNYTAYRRLKKIIQNEKYDLVHTHTPIASACVRIACRKLKNVKVFYTAHGFHFYKGAPIKNWLIFYPIEKWLSKYTDVLITINKEDYQRAKKSFEAERIEYIPGVGLDIDKFRNVAVGKSEKRKELGLSEDVFVLLSVGELNRNKNHEIVIRALAKINNPNLYYIICGRGPLGDYLGNLIKELGLEEQVRLLGYRKDIAEIYKAADAFVFPSYREGLPVSLMEAMASGLSVVCSKIRGNVDLIDKRGGVLFNPHSVKECKTAIEQLLALNRIAVMGIYNKEKVIKNDIFFIIGQVEGLYRK